MQPSCFDFPKQRILPGRAALARTRVHLARAHLTDCRLCAHDCGVNRLSGETGRCHAGPRAQFFSAQVEVSDEPEFIPTFAVALSGCDLRCAFCITGAESWNAQAGEWFDARAVAGQAEEALRNGARSVVRKLKEIALYLKNSFKTIILVSPTIEIPTELGKEITALNYPLPSRDDLSDLLDKIIADVSEFKHINVELDDHARERLLQASLGLTLGEAETCSPRSSSNQGG